jgi:hypothetical protein
MRVSSITAAAVRRTLALNIECNGLLVTAAAAAGLASSAVSALSGASFVLLEAALAGIGVRGHRAAGQVLALIGLHSGAPDHATCEND